MSNKSIVNNIVSEHDVMVNQFNLFINNFKKDQHPRTSIS